MHVPVSKARLQVRFAKAEVRGVGRLSHVDENRTERIHLVYDFVNRPLRVALDRVNDFFADEWPTYKQAVEEANPNAGLKFSKSPARKGGIVYS